MTPILLRRLQGNVQDSNYLSVDSKNMFKIFILTGTDKTLKNKVKAYIVKNVTHPYGYLACMNTVYCIIKGMYIMLWFSDAYYKL